MDKAVELVTLTEKFVKLVKGSLIPGRRFDRVQIDDATVYFIEKNTQSIYGAKSSFQYNPRRYYGFLAQMDQMDWSTHQPIANTTLSAELASREASIKSGYKQRGRPRKAPVTQ